MSPVRVIKQSLLLVFIGSLMGLGINWASPRPARLVHPVYPASSSGTATCTAAPQPPTVMSQADAIAACGSCSVGFVDARGTAAYASGHIPGAVHLPPQGQGNETVVFDALRRFPTIVVYDSGSGCQLAQAVAERLRAAGFADVRMLESSWATWQSTGGPAQSGTCQACSTGNHHLEARP